MKKNIFNKILLTGVALLAPTIVNAKSANIDIVGKNTTNVNDTITLNVKVNNIDDVEGIVAVGGDIVFDSDYLTLISTSAAVNPYAFDGNQINNNTYRIAGVDFTMANYITSDTTVYSLVFKTNKVGQTSISFKNAEVIDTDAVTIDTTSSTKVVSILDNEEAKEVEENNSVEVKNINNTKETINTTNVTNKIMSTSVRVEDKKDEVIINANNIKLSIIDRLHPVAFDKEVDGLRINEVKYYSIYNYMRER